MIILLNVPLTLYMKVGLSQSLPLLEQWIKRTRLFVKLSHKADLIGGVRLPNTAFKQIAGTEVTTDVLFFRKHSGIQEQAEEQLLERRQALWVETTNVPSGITREDGSVQPPMTMNNYFHKHMLTHTLGRYHFKTIEEERIRLIQERKTLADRITKGFKHDGQSISLCKNNEIILTRGIADCRRTKKLLLIQIFLNLALVRKMVKFIITVLME